jgi:hypothetical protein
MTSSKPLCSNMLAAMAMAGTTQSVSQVPPVIQVAPAIHTLSAGSLWVPLHSNAIQQFRLTTCQLEQHSHN